jgi:hypothetical protein
MVTREKVYSIYIQFGKSGQTTVKKIGLFRAGHLRYK